MTHSFPTRRSSDLGETHTADVYAVRDSVLLRLPAPTVLEAFQQFPAALLRLTRLIARRLRQNARSEEHTSELQSLMRISYAVFCLKKKTCKTYKIPTTTSDDAYS